MRSGSAQTIARFGACVVAAGILFGCRAVLAQAISMGIDPARFEFTALPGQELGASVAFSNGSGTQMPIHVEGADFRPVGEDGKIAVGESPDEGRSLKNWIAPGVRDLVALANAKTSIDFAIRVPSDAMPGAYWGVLVLRDQGQFHLAPIILVNVLGEAPEKLTLASLQGSVSATGSLKVVARFRNDGAMYEKPAGAVVVRNIFGGIVAEGMLPTENVLPGYVRRFAISVGSGLWPGPYVATVAARYGSANHVLGAERTVWVVPKRVEWRLVSVVGICLAGGLMLVRRRRRGAE
jgi:hypothetical protein